MWIGFAEEKFLEVAQELNKIKLDGYEFFTQSVKHEGALYKGLSFASSGSLETGTMHFYASRSNRELISLRDRTRNYK